MQMAKASEKDLSAALDLCGVLEDIDRGYFPRPVPADENQPYTFSFFDEDNPEHLRALYDRIKACLEASSGGGMFRVMFGMTVVLDPKNAIVDPESDFLKLHPRLEAALAAQESAVAQWQPIESAPKDGTTVLVGVQHEMYGFVRGYGRFKGNPGAFVSGWISNGFSDPPGNLGLGNPTHWMPIPPPPAMPGG